MDLVEVLGGYFLKSICYCRKQVSEKRIFHNSKVREARGLVSLFGCFLDGGDFDQQTD